MVEYMASNIQIQIQGLRFKDLEDLKAFIDSLNQTEGKRLGFKLVVLNVKRGKRLK